MKAEQEGKGREELEEKGKIEWRKKVVEEMERLK